MDAESLYTRREVLKNLAVLAGLSASSSCAAVSSPALPLHVARYWHRENGNIACELCPNACILPDKGTGTCRNRRNHRGTLYAIGYGKVCSTAIDPIEKKPVFHVLPGARTFSIAIAGCNLRCKNCQNYQISQVSPEQTDVEIVSPEKVVQQAVRSGCEAIAFTYSEPTAWYEYTYDTAKIAKSAGLKTVLVSSGYINPAPLVDLAKYIDAAHFDLKSFSEKIYAKLNEGKLAPVLTTLTTAKNAGIWVEVINLIVPQWTDNLDMIRSMCTWLNANMGADTPLHFSRFFPLYQLSYLMPTPAGVLKQAREIAMKEGLHFVYTGNLAEAEGNTYCPSCGMVVIGRDGYIITARNIKNGCCAKCGAAIAGIWGM